MLTKTVKQGKLSDNSVVSHINMHIKPLKDGYLLSSESFKSKATEKWFLPGYWQAKNAIVDSKKGRTTAWFYEYENTVYVLKHYRRGGLIGKLLSDQYLYTGLENTRIYREFVLLKLLQEQGLPAPVPKAAQVRVSGLIYRGDIVTEAINGATSVCEVCQTRSLDAQELKEIAQTLATFHNAGIYHADLNINNILFDDQGKAYLIDFDRGEVREPNSQWQQSNISRLKRSFDKEAQKWTPFHFNDDNWGKLLSWYQEALL